VTAHQTLFQHQHGYVHHLTWKAPHTKRDKRHFSFWNLCNEFVMKFVKSNHRATLKIEHLEELICTTASADLKEQGPKG